MDINPLAKLDPRKHYTVRDVLFLCNLGGDPAEMMIMRFYATKVCFCPIRLQRILRCCPHLRLVAGTGAEFQFAYDTGMEVIALCKRVNPYLFKPGRPPIALADPLPPTFVPLFMPDVQSN